MIRREGTKIEWNTTFGQAALDLRFAPELCWPYRPKEKGSVENLVGWVKGSFFKVRRFANRDDLERQLLKEVSGTRPSRATGVIPPPEIAAGRFDAPQHAAELRAGLPGGRRVHVSPRTDGRRYGAERRTGSCSSQKRWAAGTMGLL